MADNLEARIQIAVDAASAAQSVGELKSAIKELEGIAIVAGESNKAAFLKAAQEAGKLKDQIDDTKDAISTFKGDPLESVSKGIGSLKGRLMDLDFKGFSEEVGRLSTISKSVSFKDLAGSVTETAGSFVKLGRVLLTNPIFLIASAIALAIANLDTLLGLIDGVSSAEQERLDIAKETAAASKEQLDAISAQEETLKANGMSEEEILQLKIDAAKVAAADAKAQLDAQKVIRDNQIKASERNAKILSGVLQFITAPLQVLLMGVDKFTEALKTAGIISEEAYATVGNLRDRFNQGVTSLVFDPEKVKEEGDAAVKEAEKSAIAIQNTLDGFENKKKDNKKKANDAAAAEAQKEAEKEKARLEKENADRIAAEEKLQKLLRDTKEQRLDEEEALAEEIFQAGLSAQQKELIALNDYYFEKIELAKQYGLDTTNLVEEQARKENEINQKYRDEDAANRKKAEEDAESARLADLEKKQARQDALLTGASQVFGSLIDLNNTFEGKTEKERKKSFERNKKLQIAQALIQTYQGAQAIFASAAANPGTVLFPAQPFIAAGAAITAGLLNINKIRKTQYESPTPDTSTPPPGDLGGGGGGGGAPAPTFTPPQFFGLGQGQLQSGQSGGQQQVVVLENDITRTQNRVRVIENRATIG
jgi:hypothetical protein